MRNQFAVGSWENRDGLGGALSSVGDAGVTRTVRELLMTGEDSSPDGRKTFETGIPALDCGLDAPANAFILVGGQTGIGLTSMLARISLPVLRASRTVLWVGASGNDRLALGRRLVASESGVLLPLVDEYPTGLDEPRARVLSAHERLADDRLVYLPRAQIDPNDIAEQASHASEAGWPLGLIVVDLPSEVRRERASGDLWLRMKAIAERHCVPVIVGVPMRDHKKYVRRFRLRDFDIAADGLQLADLVLGLTRQSFFERFAGQAVIRLGVFVMEVDVVKNRHGRMMHAMCIFGPDGKDE